MPNDFLPIPAAVALCPYCGLASLVAEFDEYDAETRQPTEIGTHVSCSEADESDPNDHTDMPYLHWLPVQDKVYQWLQATGYTVPEDLGVIGEKLRAWNAGEPIKARV